MTGSEIVDGVKLLRAGRAVKVGDAGARKPGTLFARLAGARAAVRQARRSPSRCLTEDVVAVRPAPQVDPDAGIPDLVRRLTDDSKRLVRDEVRLAKLETGEAIHNGARGALWLGLAFGAGVVALVALTIMLATLIGRWLGHYWAGTLIVAVLELVAAMLLIR